MKATASTTIADESDADKSKTRKSTPLFYTKHAMMRATWRNSNAPAQPVKAPTLPAGPKSKRPDYRNGNAAPYRFFALPETASSALQ